MKITYIEIEANAEELKTMVEDKASTLEEIKYSVYLKDMAGN